ncbi:hypothetical protein HNQ51_000277 [Inhella inkyongensis]|uniref:CopC domain-containing protein n=1 Tax=Inhella inkyongensis TaxID=392593 RepID=A0A840S2A5_9BURK|nr:hypothetical protein [Inhella inkyongensis]MBB5202984.1 hypothetical protein [Inhella inkyongensis]
MNAASVLLCLILAGLPLASRAHGPEGDHDHGPATPAAGPSVLPRTEAATEAFELVATLEPHRLAIVIDRFATNEPVLQAKLTVESGGLKAEARFDPEHGDYAVSSPELLARLRTPGQHALVFTLLAAEESDLLDAQLNVASANDAHTHRPLWVQGAYGAGALLLLGAGVSVGVGVWRRRAVKGGL